MKTHSNSTKQGERILEVFKRNPGVDIPAVALHHAGSGSYDGWCSSFTRRISDLRAQGYNIVKSRDERQADGSRWTWYRYTPDIVPPAL